nr:S-ribosylhomocysteine lyase [Virgibacillus indicus]
MPALHSLEQINSIHHDRVIDLGPMGCQIGFL